MRQSGGVIGFLPGSWQGAAARRETRFFHFLNGVEPVGIRMGLADLAVIALAGIQIVVDRVDAGLFKLPRLTVGQKPQTTADFQMRIFFPHRFDAFYDLVELALGGTASRG